MHKESLSVLLPVRNGGAHIAIVLEDLAISVAEGDEILVVDDGSTDRTADLVASSMERYAHIRLIRTGGIGLIGALTLGIEESTNPWIARADADDRYPANRLRSQRAVIAPGIAAITGDYRVTGPSQGGTIPCALGAPFTAISLVHPQRFPHPGVMFHRDAVLEAGGYKKLDYPAEDLGLWIRLANVGDFVGVHEVVVDWRMNPTSITHSNQVAQRAKTAELLAGFRLPQASKVTADDVEAELQRYVGTPHAHERAVLLARDLWTARRLGVPAPAIHPVLAHLGLRPGSSIRALRGLAQDARSRQQYRESM